MNAVLKIGHLRFKLILILSGAMHVEMSDGASPSWQIRSTWIPFDFFEVKDKARQWLSLIKKMTNEAGCITEKCDQINKIYGCAV